MSTTIHEALLRARSAVIFGIEQAEEGEFPISAEEATTSALRLVGTLQDPQHWPGLPTQIKETCSTASSALVLVRSLSDRHSPQHQVHLQHALDLSSALIHQVQDLLAEQLLEKSAEVATTTAATDAIPRR